MLVAEISRSQIFLDGKFGSAHSGLLLMAGKRCRVEPPFLAWPLRHQFRTLCKKLTPGHLRSGHQVKSSDPTSESLRCPGTLTCGDLVSIFFYQMCGTNVPLAMLKDGGPALRPFRQSLKNFMCTAKVNADKKIGLARLSATRKKLYLPMIADV